MSLFRSLSLSSVAASGALSAMLAWAPAAAALPSVSITDLGFNLAYSTDPQAIFPQGLGPGGQVVGTYRLAGNYQGFATGPGGVGFVNVTPSAFGGTAYGINAAGQVAGGASGQAFFYDPAAGGLRLLGTLGGIGGLGTAINASGQVTGNSLTTDNAASHAFISGANGGALTDLGTLGGASVGWGINAHGVVTGYSALPDGGPDHAFVASVSGGIRDAGTLGGDSSYAYSINDSGSFVGMSQRVPGGYFRAFIGYDNGGPLQELGTLGGGGSSVASAINNGHEVVGTSDAAGGVRRAFLWADGTMIDLNTLDGVAGSGWTLEGATSIDDDGHILGYGTFNGQQRVFLLTAVPEPSTYLLTALGLGLAAAAARRRAKR